MWLQDYAPDDIDVRIAELLVATADAADPLLHPKVSEVLGILREHMKMDVVFVSQFKDHRRTFKVVRTDPKNTVVVAGQSDPLEDSWCQHVVDGRVPQLLQDAREYVERGELPPPRSPIGTYLSTPVVLKNGSVYGTLCCFSSQVKEDVNLQDLRRLQITAKVLAEDLLNTRVGSEFELQPIATPGRLDKGPP